MKDSKKSKPILITCQPTDTYFVWQNHMYIESCLAQGFEEEQIHILLYNPIGRAYNSSWDNLKKCYPKLNIFVYEDKGVQQFLGTYIPILRPHILWQHFEAFPELQDRTIVYTDCDILWTDNMNINHLLEDDINYVSDANSYLNHSYFESKYRDVLPEKLEEAKSIDFLKGVCDIVGIDKQVVIDNNSNTGGVQYILKDIDSLFWKKVEIDVLKIRMYLQQMNRDYFKDENSGIQSWCADLWAVQFNLWFFNKESKVAKELDFAWSTDPIIKLNTYPILHNAGIVSETGNGYPAFYKGKYHMGTDPTKDPNLDAILNDEKSKKYCTWFYATKLNEIKNKYKLDY
jgi:hypothetical protein